MKHRVSKEDFKDHIENMVIKTTICSGPGACDNKTFCKKLVLENSPFNTKGEYLKVYDGNDSLIHVFAVNEINAAIDLYNAL